MTEKISPVKKLLINAQCMNESAQELSKQLMSPEKTTVEGAAQYIGSVVLYAFAIELYLKALGALTNGGKFPWGHELKKLFDEISDESLKQSIEKTYKQKTNEDLDAFLSENNCSFTEWRYFFESQEGLTFSPSSASALLSIIAPVAVALNSALENG